MVRDTYNNFVKCAQGLPGFIVGRKEDVPYDITELMNGYCQAKDKNDKVKMNQYISALFVRYWHMVVMLYNKSESTHLEFEEFIFWVYEAFEKAAYYRSWLDNTKEVSKSPRGAEKCINQCITSVRQFWYKHFNQDKRKLNFIISDSLEDYLPYGPDDTPVMVKDNLADPDENIYIDDGRDLIQHYINKNKVFEAVVLDGILYHDCYTTDSYTEVIGQDDENNNIEVTRNNFEFSQSKLKRYLRGMTDEDIDLFVSCYDVYKEAVIEVINQIKGTTKAQLFKKVEKAFKSFRCNREIKNWLCI